MSGLCLLVGWPLLQIHVLLAERNDASWQTDAFISFQNLPDVQFLVSVGFVSDVDRVLFGIELDIRPQELSLVDVTEAGSLSNNISLRYFPPEFDLGDAISDMSTFHVLVDQGDGNDEVQVECVDNISEHADHDGQRRVFKIR